MNGPALASAAVLVSTAVLAPLFLYAAVTETGGLAGGLLAGAVAALVAVAAVTVRSLRDGRM